MFLYFQCTSFTNGATVGNLCNELCQPEVVPSVACHNYYEKSTVFSVQWNHTNIVFKSAKKSSQSEVQNWPDTGGHFYQYEHYSSNLIKTAIKLKFNISISNGEAVKLLYLYFSFKSPHKSRAVENIRALIEDNEYLALILYERFDVFPKLIGTCGPLYAVQKLNTVSGFWHLMTLYDSHDDWIKRIKIAIKIIEFLVRLENGLPEPLLICNVKMTHFGVTDDFKKVMYLDLDSVHPISIASQKTGDGSECRSHSDCDFMNCRSFCNLITLKCQHGVVNNNLQIVCERIFLGWVMSGKVMVPGLLMGPHTPHVLIELLEECANPAGETGMPRAMATKEIGKRLHDLLVHITY